MGAGEWSERWNEQRWPQGLGAELEDNHNAALCSGSGWGACSGLGAAPQATYEAAERDGRPSGWGENGA